MRRVAVIAALIAMSIAVLTAGPRRSILDTRWYGYSGAYPLQGDIPYRLGLALQAAPSRLPTDLGIDPEDLMQSGIGVYERLALRREEPNVQALFRLAVIYSKQGNPEEALELFQRLVQLDMERAGLYLAVSSVYDTKPVQMSQLGQAAAIIGQEDDWLARLVLVDLYRRLGDKDRQRRADAAMIRQDHRYALCLGTVAAIYMLLAAIGAVLLFHLAWCKLFRLPSEQRRPPLSATWSALDAVEVGAVLLFAMVFVGLLADSVTRGWEDRGGAPWVTALVVLLSYVLFCLLALFVMRKRMGPAAHSPLRILGLGQRLRLSAALHGVAGYSVLVATLALLALLVHWAGLDYLPVAAQSATDLLQQARGAPEMAIYFVLICLAAPLLEETIFRGFIYAGLRQRFGPAFAILLSALVFGGAHVTLALGGMLAIGLVGVLLAYLYERTRVLWPSIVAHALHNVLVFAIIVATNT